MVLACAFSVQAQRTISPMQQAYAQQTQVLRDMQRSLQMISARIDTMESQMASLSSRISAVEKKEAPVSQADLDALRADLAAVKRSQGDLRGEIVGDLSQKMAAIQAKQAAAAKEAKAVQKSGYTHVIESGQTLSAIAQHYKVSVRAIMKANKITDPTKLRVGQEIFVPDP